MLHNIHFTLMLDSNGIESFFFSRQCAKRFAAPPKEGVVVGSAHDQCDEERFYGNGKNIISCVLFFSFQS